MRAAEQALRSIRKLGAVSCEEPEPTFGRKPDPVVSAVRACRSRSVRELREQVRLHAGDRWAKGPIQADDLLFMGAIAERTRVLGCIERCALVWRFLQMRRDSSPWRSACLVGLSRSSRDPLPDEHCAWILLGVPWRAVPHRASTLGLSATANWCSEAVWCDPCRGPNGTALPVRDFLRGRGAPSKSGHRARLREAAAHARIRRGELRLYCRAVLSHDSQRAQANSEGSLIHSCLDSTASDSWDTRSETSLQSDGASVYTTGEGEELPRGVPRNVVVRKGPELQRTLSELFVSERVEI